MSDEIIEVLKPGHVSLAEEDVRALLEKANRLQEEKNQTDADIMKLIEILKNILLLFGILDANTREIKQSLKTGDESYMKVLMYAAKGIVTDLMLRPDKLQKDFGFIEQLLPVLEKYGNK